MNTFALFNTHRWPFVGPLIPGSTPCSKPHSVGVPEVWRSFNDQFLTIRFSIGPSEIDKVLDHQKNVESLERNADDQCRPVTGRIFGLKDVACNDTSDTSTGRHHGCTQSTFWLSNNIVLLICPVGRYIGCNPHHADEDTSISRMGAFTVCGNQHANDVQHRIEDQHWTTDLEPVANPGTEENPRNCNSIWWKGEELSFRCRVVKTLLQDDWQEICECVQ